MFIPVTRNTGGTRPEIYLFILNTYLFVPHFRMETNISTKACIPPGMWMTKLDLSDAYLHIPISRACSKYLRFVWNDNIYQLLALLFGLAVAPQVLAEFSDSSNSRAYPVCSGPLLFGRLTLGTNFSRLGSLSSYFSAFRLPCTRKLLL